MFISYLDEFIPASGNDDRVLGVGAEANAGDPFGMSLVGDGELAVTQSVPQLDGPVAGPGHDLAVVGRERDGQNIIGVANKGSGGVASSQFPETKGLIPRGRKRVSTIGGDHLFFERERKRMHNNQQILLPQKAC